MSIQRWTVADPARMSVVPAQDGDLVTHADHLAAVEAAYREGYSDHARTVQHWQDTHGAYRQHGEGENP